MKHRVAFRKLNRTSEHRWAMLRTMVDQLINHERIHTTLPKAKELRRVADHVVTIAKKGDICAQQKAYTIVRTKESFDKLFQVLAPRYADRDGGYTRIMKADFRRGDNAEMAYIEYIERPGEMRRARPGQRAKAYVNKKVESKEESATLEEV